MPLLHGIRLSLDDAATRVLAPWLSGNEHVTAPTVEVHLESLDARPRVRRVLAREQGVWLGETEQGLIVGRDDQSWFTIRPGSPACIRGALASVPQHGDGLEERKLMQGALLAALAHDHVYELHAGVVCTARRALVLLGDSGAGKSTTTTALVAAGCRYLGDDSAMLRENDGEVELLSYSSNFRLTDHALETFPTLRSVVRKPEPFAKWQFDAATVFCGQYLSSWRGPITLIRLARAERAASVLSPLSPADVTGTLISQSTALGLECHPTPKAHLALLAKLASRADCQHLELGTEWLTDPNGAAGRLLENLRESTRGSPAEGAET